MFDTLTNKLSAAFSKITSRGVLSEKDIDEAMREIRIALLEADVSLPVVRQFIAAVKEQALGEKVVRSVQPGQMVVKIVHDELVKILGSDESGLNFQAVPPVCLLMVGLQGSGKTTTSAKIAARLKGKKKVLLASLDVYRPAAQEQLAQLAAQIGVAALPVVKGEKPEEITRRALKTGKNGGYDVIILDTAGRQHIDEALMNEVVAVKKIAEPTEVLLVADSMIGQEACNVAREFNEKVGLTGIILTRVDGSSRAGAALSMRIVSGAPIKFLGTGEKIDEFEEFHPDRLAGRILGQGDVVSLVEKTMEKIVALCKGRGFVFSGSEIYGGLANTWDYGPLGVELKNNVKKAWWKKFVQENPYNVGQDSAILMNPQTWVASGHLGGFSDPLMDCKACKERFRADKLIEDFCAEQGMELPKPIDAFSQDEMAAFIEEHQIPCPSCGKHDFTGIRQFNLMFKTFQGVTEDAKNTVYLRPETAQGIFVNFNNIQRTTRRKLPFGVCQIGKSFRNEITPGNFTFRTREFEQMELEFFCKPGTDLEWFQYWRTYCHDWLLGLNIKDENLRLRDHDPEELCFYSKATTDFEFLFPFGWGELWGVADRTDYDLSQHQKTSGVDMTYFDQEQNQHYIPYVVEPSLGADRVTLAFLVEAYDEEVVGQDKNGKDDIRVVLHFHPALAPFKAAVLPLSKKLGPKATEIYHMLQKDFMVDYDEAGSIGKRYRREDEIGTPYCITVDFQTVGDENTPADNAVTIRDRDTMEQVRVPIDQLKAWLTDKLAY